MIDDISDMAAAYDHSVDDEESRLEMHQLEYNLTSHGATSDPVPATDRFHS